MPDATIAAVSGGAWLPTPPRWSMAGVALELSLSLGQPCTAAAVGPGRGRELPLSMEGKGRDAKVRGILTCFWDLKKVPSCFHSVV